MNTEKILIIEDEELIREELKTLLSNAGYVVDCVVDFGETLNYIKLTSPDLILLDVNLPGQDGYRLCTSIRSFAAIPILFITGRNTAMDELQALTLGGDDYIAKPYNVPILLARINLLLHRGRGEQNYMIYLLFLSEREGMLKHYIEAKVWSEKNLAKCVAVTQGDEAYL